MLSQINNVNVLHKLISAYRPGHSCQDVLLFIINSFTQALDKKLNVAAVTTDLSAAFDCMPPNLMYHKLIAYGFTKNSALLIHNYLSNRSQRVKIGDVVGEWMDLAKGTPQGSKLGPALFNLFINDLLYTLPEGSTVNFADDNTLYAIDKSPRALESKINSLVNQAQMWFIENGMQSNPTKFQSISFGNTPQCKVIVGDICIESVPFIKLLGVNIDSNLKFNVHIAYICQKAGRNLNALKRISKTLPTSVKLLLYKTYITCHFNFCPLVWHFCGESNTNKLERIQTRALRFVFDDYESDPTTLLQKAKIPSLEISRQRQMCIEVFKCIHDLSPKYMSDLFSLQDKDLHNTRNVKALVQCHYDTVGYGAKTFVNFSTHLWNKLPSSTRIG